jgi:predicted transcriptional regulator
MQDIWSCVTQSWRALESLMEDNNLRQSELARRLEAPQLAISEFLSGKRGLSKIMNYAPEWTRHIEVNSQPRDNNDYDKHKKNVHSNLARFLNAASGSLCSDLIRLC